MPGKREAPPVYRDNGRGRQDYYGPEERRSRRAYDYEQDQRRVSGASRQSHDYDQRSSYARGSAPDRRRSYDYDEETYERRRSSSDRRRAYDYEEEDYDRRRSSQRRDSGSRGRGGNGGGGGGRRPPDNRRGGSGNRRRRRMPVWQKVIITVLVFLLLLVLLMVGLVWAKLGHIDRIGSEHRINASDETFDVDEDGREDTLGDADVNFAEGDTIADKNVINILLIGRDARGEERGRSDSMILVSLNRKTEQISMVSLMRDSYVQIPGYSNNKLNSAFSFGGYELLDETIAKNYGIEIDFNVGVNFDGFEKVVDQLGGIDVELTQAECDYLMNDIYTNAGHLTPGINRLDGNTALSYARARYVGTGKEANDFGRTYRQRVVLTTVYKEMMKKPLTEIWTILDSIMDCVETDMTNTQIVSLGTEFYNMGIDDLQNYRLPQDGQYTDEKINKMAVLVLDWDAARQNLQTWLYSETPAAPHDINAHN